MKTEAAMRMSVICREWTVAVLGTIAACTAVCATTACSPATTTAGPANPSVASAPAAESPTPGAASAPATVPSSPGTNSDSAGDCRATDLAYQAQVPGAAAGNYYDAILVINHGAGACRLGGYPNLYYTDASGATKLVPTVPETPDSPPYLVASGGSAQFIIHTANGYGGYGASAPQCAHPMLYRGLSVEVSGGRVPLPDVGIDLECGDIRLLGWAAPQPR
jgi:hypothetical protein